MLRGAAYPLYAAWRADCEQRKQETIEAVKATAHEQVPYNVQGVSVSLCDLIHRRDIATSTSMSLAGRWRPKFACC